MKPMYRYLAAVPLTLRVIMTLAVSSLLIEPWLRTVPEVVWWGSNFGDVYFRLCLAMVSSFIFFFIVVHVPKEKDKDHLLPFVSQKLKTISTLCRRQFAEMEQALVSKQAAQLPSLSNPRQTFPTIEEIDTVFAATAPRDPSPLRMNGNHIDWFAYWSVWNRMTAKCVRQILDHSRFLDAALITPLAKLEDCNHMNVGHFSGQPMDNPDMMGWSFGFKEYVYLCEELHKYREQKMARHKPHYWTPTT